MPFARGKTFSMRSKERKKNKKKAKKKGGFRAKWGGPSGRLTWPLNPPKQTNKPQKKLKEEKKKTIKQKTTKKRTFNYQSFLSFLVGVQHFPFLTTWPTKRAPKNTLKIWVSTRHFWKRDMRHETAIFEKKSRNSSCHYFCLFLLFQRQKHNN